MNASQICTTLSTLKSLRSPHEQVWRDCYDHSYPIRGSGFCSEQITAIEAQMRKARMLDGTTTDAARILSSSIMSGLTPANSLWFGMDVGQETEDERRWLDDSADILWQNIHASNFDAAAFEGMLDEVCAGWFALYIDSDKERGGFTFDLWPIASVYCSASKAGGKIDTVYREYQLTAQQAVNEFGEANVSENTRKLAQDKPQEMVRFIHAIYPRSTYMVGARLAKNMPIASCKVEVEAKRMVSESGYHEMPVVVPRWMMIPNSVYAVGPVFDALPDARTLNDLCRMDLAAGDLAIAGMWIAEDDGVLNPRTVKVGPRKIIVANSVDSMKPLQSGSNFQYAETKIQRLQASIRKILMADQLQAQDGPAMTATEVHVRVNLIRQLLGPVYGRLQTEYLQPLIERCFGIAYRAGILGQAPESLAGRNFTVRYLSPLARAQKLEEVNAIDQFVAGALGIVSATQDPSILDNIDLDEAQRFKGEALGVPNSIIRSKADRDKIRADRAQAQQDAQEQAQQQMMMQQAGEAAMRQQPGAAA
ncbi:Bacteriophage head to tail connecting protein [Pseudomonas saponiphila]|uniref:Bacteriophage head to tail connecting protein n=1 Tax=Pseudomonas saponiphila TaxID=556534 RepID=A0A1H4LR88_9PSED|nr:portal protein [Pseudomonas saponiphila]SEB73114.1 Bacteriophage head to tail connecting protein [Pseudomonas saponiphila]